jgi:hypothetical protein
MDGAIGMVCGHGAFFCIVWVIECREGGCLCVDFTTLQSGSGMYLILFQGY